MNRTQEEWIDRYQKVGALWMHDGNPRRPHATVRSGHHTNGFFLSRMVIDDDRELRREAAEDLVELVKHYGPFNLCGVDCVVGPATGATKLAESIASVIGRARNGSCRFASPVKEGEGADLRMVFRDSRIESGDRCLLVEDVLTTGGSVVRAARAITDAGGSTLPFVLCLVNRSGQTDVNGWKIVSLIERHLPTWPPDECPLCLRGSAAIPAKQPPENWNRLCAEYPA